MSILSGGPQLAVNIFQPKNTKHTNFYIVQYDMMCMHAYISIRFERLLGGSVAPLLLAIATELSREGKHLGGRGARAAIAKGPHLLRLTRSITSRELDREGHPLTFDLLWELYEEEKKAAEASWATEGGSGAAVAAAGGRAVKQEAWAASVVSDGDEDGVGSPEDDVAAKGGDGEEVLRISTGDESGVGVANDIAPVLAPAAEEKRRPRRPSSGRPKGVDPDDECGQRGALRSLVGRRREGGGGTIRKCWGGRGEQQGCRGRTQGNGEERECRDVEEGVVEDGKAEEEGREVMGPEMEERAISSACCVKGALEQRRGRKPKIHGASSWKAKRGSGGEEERRSAGWKWKKDLCSLLKLMGGLDKVTKPTSAQHMRRRRWNVPRACSNRARYAPPCRESPPSTFEKKASVCA